MSGVMDLEAADDGPRMLAAEYVLGTLDTAEAAQAERQQLADPVFAADIRFWEQRLLPLTTFVTPVPPPPSLWTRIEDTTAARRASAATTPVRIPSAANDNGLRLWRAAAIAGFAVAASLVAFIALRPVPAPVFAVLAPTGSTAGLLVVVAETNTSVLVRPSGTIGVASGRDLELWALPAGATRPTSLGLLPVGGRRLTTTIVPGTQLLVSVEPKGGSPTGLPTGKVVYGGKLLRLE